MGLFQFAKSAGRKLGLVEDDATPPDPARAESDRDQQRDHLLGTALAQAIREHGLDIEGLAVTITAGRAAIAGKAATQSDREKAVLVVGNTEGVEAVDDRMTVAVYEPPTLFHTVEEGDTLAAIAARYYGIMRLYEGIFAANQPMLTDADAIYPGQVLRIPRVAPPVHTVARGETLGNIAKHWYGDAKKYSAIHMANMHVIENPSQIEVGWELVIPAKGEAVDLPQAPG